MDRGFTSNFSTVGISETVTNTTTPFHQLSTTVEASEGKTRDLTEIITISVSVLVSVCLLYVAVWCMCSDYRPCCKEEEEETNIEELHNFGVSSSNSCTPASSLIQSDRRGPQRATPQSVTESHGVDGYNGRANAAATSLTDNLLNEQGVSDTTRDDSRIVIRSRDDWLNPPSYESLFPT